MLKLLFQRYSALLVGKSLSEALLIIPGTPEEVVRAFSSEKPEMSDYLGLDDHSISQFCKACERSNDTVLSRLGSGILHRRYLKAIDATGCSPDAVASFTMKASDLLNKRGYDAEFSFSSDSPGDTPYKVYDPDAETPNTQIYIENREGKQAEISSLSEPVSDLRKKYALARFYFPAELRDDVQKIADSTLRN